MLKESKTICHVYIVSLFILFLQLQAIFINWCFTLFWIHSRLEILLFNFNFLNCIILTLFNAWSFVSRHSFYTKFLYLWNLTLAFLFDFKVIMYFVGWLLNMDKLLWYDEVLDVPCAGLWFLWFDCYSFCRNRSALWFREV